MRQILEFLCKTTYAHSLTRNFSAQIHTTKLYLDMPRKRKSDAKKVEEAVEEPKAKKSKKQKDEENEALKKDVSQDKVPKKGKGRKKKDDDGATEEASTKKEKKPKVKRESIPDIKNLDFSNTSKNEDGKKWNMKFSSWNINGIRAWLDKNGHSYISAENADIFCVQETKCNTESLPAEREVPGYSSYWLAGDKDGYSGTGLYSKEKPMAVTYGIGAKEHDSEGRVITAEYKKFYFVTSYVPNAGRGLVRHKYRTEKWDPAFRKYLKTLDAKKPVIMCGDLNVAHEEIDIANPKSNTKSAGFTPEEREGFSKLLEEGFIDSFRHLYPEEKAYSYWTYMMNARSRNIGWRLDYFVISEQLKANLCDSLMRKDVMGSDHCPIVCFMHF